MKLLLDFVTALAWIVGAGTALGFLVCVLGYALLTETPAEHRRTGVTAGWLLKWGILPWAWLIARYCMGGR